MLDLDQIQGNILLPFGKLHQAVVCLRVYEDAEDTNALQHFKEWLADYRSRVTYTKTVRATQNRLRVIFGKYQLAPPRAGTRFLDRSPDARSPRAQAWREAEEPDPDVGPDEDLDATWVQIAFSHRCLKRLDPTITYVDQQFADDWFRLGMSGDSYALGDPTDPKTPGHRSQWVVGGEEDSKRADVFVLLANDKRPLLDDALCDLEQSLKNHHSLACVSYCEIGDLVSTDKAEHFGYRDGFSQPGILGRASTAMDDYLTRRKNPLDKGYEGFPGQQLVWPGEFVFSYVGQVAGETEPDHGDTRPSPPGPRWSRNGSYLTFRRLHQDVQAYRDFLAHEAGAVHADDPTEYLAAKLMGRWRDGAPIVRAPTASVVVDGLQELCTSNNFDFRADRDQILTKRDPDDCTDLDHGSTGDQDLPGARADRDGITCPFVGHLRKMYWRDDTTRDATDISTRRRMRRRSSEKRRILRRGLAYGPAYQSPVEGAPDTTDRGLLFLAYQASIENQFRWLVGVANTRKHPDGTPDDLRGLDPILGQRRPGSDSGGIPIICEEDAEDGSAKELVCRRLPDPPQWVIPTGGEYLFVPSRDALAELSG
jgi:deferrochelatase/peroxidase EfeB